MPAKIKLTYFGIKGLAEPSRLILAQAGAEYEDCRITQEEWPALKESKSLKYVTISAQMIIFLYLFI